MLSTQRHGSSTLTIKEILENGFVAGASSHSHSSPVQSYSREFGSASKSDTWELLMDLNSTEKGSFPCVVKQSESLSSCVKTDLHSLTQGISDLSLVCHCKAHQGQATLELSGLPCEHPSRASCLMDVASQNTSTPCKKDKHSKPLESLLSMSSELVGDLSVLGKMPAPRWEISSIKSPLDASLSLDVSSEELRLLPCSKPDTPPLETSVVIPWPDTFKKQPVLIHRSATAAILLSDPDPVPVFLHQPQ
ncbi:hypothetical protein WISP_133522 [Willisornis vidua]|uniref:Uncharacterized protein n=1 Tax=Willisornis vidua TaxID=1566151 RepID=A0ABQ9CU26_9PASS|nr:hypothetical protein WISP_133522 [Willisornis vidua]